MIVFNEEEKEELRKRLFECDHVIPRAGAKALDTFGDPIAVLVEVIEHMSKHVLMLEKFAQKKLAHDVSSLIVPIVEGDEVVDLPGPNKVSTTVYLTKEQFNTLREYSKKTGVPQAVMIRRGIDLVLEETEKNMAKDEKAVANT